MHWAPVERTQAQESGQKSPFSPLLAMCSRAGLLAFQTLKSLSRKRGVLIPHRRLLRLKGHPVRGKCYKVDTQICIHASPLRQWKGLVQFSPTLPCFFGLQCTAHSVPHALSCLPAATHKYVNAFSTTPSLRPCVRPWGHRDDSHLVPVLDVLA